jgi:hypothetical protein
MKNTFVFILLLLALSNLSCEKEISTSPEDIILPKTVLVVDSNPQDSKIYIDNLNTGQFTPDTIFWLKTGSHLVTLKSSIFKDSSIVVNVVENKINYIYFDYTSNLTMLGRLYLDSKPQGAAIYLNDSNTTFQTPKLIEGLFPGTYNLTYKLAGYWDLHTTAKVSSDRTITIYNLLIDSLTWVNYHTGNSTLPTNYFKDIAIQEGHIKWIASQGFGLFRFDDTEWTIYKTINSSIPSDIITCVETAENGVWIGTDNGAAFLSNGIFHVYNINNSPLLTNNIECISAAPDGKVWIGTFDKGLYLFDGVNWIHYSKNNSPLPLDFIKSLFVENNGNLWIGTYGSGLVKFDGTNWTVFTEGLPASLNVEAIHVTDSEVWVACGDLGLQPGGIAVWRNNWTRYDQAGSNVVAMASDNKNNMWFGSYDIGLYKNSGTVWQGYYLYPRITGIAIDGAGNKWLSTFFKGIIKYKGE